MLIPAVSTTMPATCCTASREPHSVPPYILSGDSESQLNSLTVAALKSHLNNFKLSVTGPKSALVNRLYLHLQSLPDEGVVDLQASDPQQNVTAKAGSANSSGTDANSLEAAPRQGNNPSLPQQLISQLTTILQQAQNLARTSAIQQDTIKDDHLSAAFLPVRSNPNPGLQAATLCTSSQAIINPGTAITVHRNHNFLSLCYFLFLPEFRTR